jgi:hypothetical protein
MNRKYVIITGYTEQMAELAFNCIYTDKGAADAVADDMRQKLVDKAADRNVAEGLPYSEAEVWERTLAVAKSFIKVYELVATEL